MTLGCCLNAPGGGGGLGGVRVNGDLRFFSFFLSASLVVVECFFDYGYYCGGWLAGELEAVLCLSSKIQFIIEDRVCPFCNSGCCNLTLFFFRFICFS